MNSDQHGMRGVAMPGVWGLLLALIAACGGNDGLSPSVESPTAGAPAPADSAAPADTTLPSDSLGAPLPTDSTPPPPPDSSGMSGAVAALDNRSPLPGIVFASGDMDNKYFNSVHNGSKRGGGITPDNILGLLDDARNRKGRLILKLCMGRDSYVKNADGTFSLTKWKALIDRFRPLAPKLEPYIKDGTFLGHFLIDEPHRTAKWGGKIISHATLEAMAQYSKLILPNLTTFTHTKTPWLASTSITYRYLDAGWTQYAVGKGDITKWITTEVAAARSKGLGLLMGMNVLAGGSSSSGLRGYYPGYYSMSATELRRYGTAILNHSYACAFFMWAHNTSYYGRSDIQSAMADLSVKADAHAKTSCQQQ